MRQLSGLDSSFLHLETSHTPMHIAGLSILAPETSYGKFGFEDLRELLLSRLHVSPAFTQKLACVPLGLDNPYWETDPDFDLDRHIHYTHLARPGGWKELVALFARELEQRLPRDRPLWRILLVEGLDQVEGFPAGSTALIRKIHHAAVDGVANSALGAALFGSRNEVPLATHGDRTGSVVRAPDQVERLYRAGKELTRAPGKLLRHLGTTVKGVAKSSALAALQQVPPPPLLFTAPLTHFNAPISRKRIWRPAFFSLETLKEIRRSAGTTINDVVLTICAGALRRYLAERQGLPTRPLVALVPISIRTEREGGDPGNRLSSMRVSLATHLDDPGERLRAIQVSARGAKLHHAAFGPRAKSDAYELLPFFLAGYSARLYGQMLSTEKHRPPFNLVITNVPGPRAPLGVHGARVLSLISGSPVYDGNGLTLSVFSYVDTLSICATACRYLVPDLDHLIRHLHGAFEELAMAELGR